MSINRRVFLAAGIAGGVAAGCESGRGGVPAAAIEPAAVRPAAGRLKAVAFDGFVVIDPRPIAATAEDLFPGRGEALSNAWRTRQFEYTWLRTLAGRYADFWQVSRDALRFACASLGLAMTTEQGDRLMHSYLELKAWPEVPAALRSLRAAGVHMALLANLTAPMMDAVVANSDLQGLFEAHLSTDLVRAYKPDPRAYGMGPAAFGCKPAEMVFAASAGWDAAGAKAFGLRTFWVNRSRLPSEELGVQPDAVGNMTELMQFILGQ